MAETSNDAKAEIDRPSPESRRGSDVETNSWALPDFPPGYDWFAQDPKPEPIRDGHTWGEWRYKRSTLELELSEPRFKIIVYAIDLRITDAHGALECIVRATERGCSPQDLGSLVVALHDLGLLRPDCCDTKALRRKPPFNPTAELRWYTWPRALRARRTRIR